MNMKRRISRSNHLVTGLAAVLATSVTAYTFAAPDYARIKKDINVMVGIVKSAFKDTQECKQCSVDVSGHYLADQGVVFDINPKSIHGKFAYVFDEDVTVFPPEMPELVALPGMVHDILTDVRVSIEDEDFRNWDFRMEEDYSEETREARNQLREARRSLRELSREMRELEIEAIHASQEDLEGIESKRAELESQIAEVERNQEAFEANITRHVEQKRKEREAKMAERKEEQLKSFQKVEDIVLNTFCDYSSSMRNIPDNEKISIIVHRDPDASNIYVFDQSKLQNCDSRKTNVREHALSYAF